MSATTAPRSLTDTRVIVAHAPGSRRDPHRIPEGTGSVAGRTPARSRDDAGPVPPVVGPPAPVGPGFPARHVRGRLPGARVAAGAGRPQRHAPGTDGLLRGAHRTDAGALAHPPGP